MKPDSRWRLSSYLSQYPHWDVIPYLRVEYREPGIAKRGISLPNQSDVVHYGASWDVTAKWLKLSVTLSYSFPPRKPATVRVYY